MKNGSLKKYILYSFIGIILFLNFIMLLRGVYRFIPDLYMFGDNVETLGFYSFWADILCSIGSFTMIFVTAKSVELNDRQLNELKRQWQEEHSPYLSAQLIAQTNYFNLRIFNSSKVTADNISIKIDSYIDKEKILQFDELQSFLGNHMFTIPPMESIYFPIWITPFRELENLPNGYIEISIKTKNIDFGPLQLYPSDYAFVSYGEKDSPIINSLDKIADKIKNQKVYLK